MVIYCEVSGNFKKIRRSAMDHNAFILLLLLSGTFSVSWSVLQFYYINENKSWPEAQSFCRRVYTDLATVGSAGDMTRLLEAVSPGYSGAVWIGLRKKWTWSTGESSDYLSWYQREPNEGNLEAACSVMTDAVGWRDWYCSSKLYFFCFNDTDDSSSRFVLIRQKLAWNEAQIYCRYYYTDLATVHNAEEQQQISSFSSAGWIGLISERWSDGTFSTFRNWAPGLPPASTVNDSCVAVVMSASGKWDYRKCDLKNPFVCYGGIQPPSRLFHAVVEWKTWSEAQRYCRARFTDLATVDNLKDVRSLMDAVDPGYSGSLWMGLTHAAKARWGWTQGDQLSTNFSNWDAEWPRGSAQCAITINGVWRDYDCDVPLYFVCYDEITGYILVETPKSWSEAQSYCRASYTDLASIRSHWEQEQVTGLAGKRVPVWVGLFLDSWQWSDQWSLQFRNWAAGEPSPGTGSCSSVGTFNAGRWTADDCSIKYPFICYGDKDKKNIRQIIRVKISSSGNSDVMSSSVQTAILREIEKNLKTQGMASNTNLTWRNTKYLPRN